MPSERRPLDSYERSLARRAGWAERVGRGRGLLVRSDVQRVMLASADRVLSVYPCSTARAGLGQREGSGCTPVGWHQIGELIGGGCPSGAVFVGRQWTGRVWEPGQDSEGDLITSRILRLRGLEPGRNRGGEVDSWRRMIYIHGTNHEDSLGSPASGGCIRLSNPDIIDLFGCVAEGCPVLVA